MPAGRPSSYTKDMADRLRAYTASGYEANGDVIPTVEGGCLEIGISKSMAYRYRDEHPEFRDALEELMQKQGRSLINKGLSGDYNSTIAKLLLHGHGYNDRQETEVSGPNGGPIQVSRIELVAIDGR
jgi:hypothetical protein